MKIVNENLGWNSVNLIIQVQDQTGLTFIEGRYKMYVENRKIHLAFSVLQKINAAEFLCYILCTDSEVWTTGMF